MSNNRRNSESNNTDEIINELNDMILSLEKNPSTHFFKNRQTAILKNNQWINEELSQIESKKIALNGSEHQRLTYLKVQEKFFREKLNKNNGQLEQIQNQRLMAQNQLRFLLIPPPTPEINSNEGEETDLLNKEADSFLSFTC